jgi:LysR family hydrogen peroxide-inducible transcriptional activator
MRASPHPFTLRQLQYAAAVADLRSFRRAAEHCHVSQPSLSAQVIQLETQLGTRLFERGARRVLITAAGEVLLARCAGSSWKPTTWWMRRGSSATRWPGPCAWG